MTVGRTARAAKPAAGRNSGVLAGIVSAAIVNAAVAIGARRSDGRGLGPADMVTLTRADMGCIVVALGVDAMTNRRRARGMVPLSAAALALDAADGFIARRTKTASRFGGRFDGEVDAFWILILSLHASRSYGWWVATGGLARYGFGAATWCVPWMRRELPPRFQRKVATAVEGIVLTAAASPSVPRPMARAGLVAGLGLIGESFARDVMWLWRRHTDNGGVAP